MNCTFLKLRLFIENPANKIAETGRTGKVALQENGGIPENGGLSFSYFGRRITNPGNAFSHRIQGNIEMGGTVNPTAIGHGRFTGTAGKVFCI